MRAQLKHAVLVAGLVCSPNWAQEFSAKPTVFPLGSIHNGLERNDWLKANAPGTCKASPVFEVLQERAEICVSPRLMLEFVAQSDYREQFQGVPVGRLRSAQAFFFLSGMTIDADGAPNAYHPDDDGLDEVANAGHPGSWNGIVTDQDGTPLIQQENDPFPGYYISCTSLFDRTKEFTDPTTYVDASRIPYVALPEELAEREGMRLGDFAFVMNLNNAKWSFAIYADVGTLGEGSIALADALGISSDARQGGQSEGVFYLLFPGSGNHQPKGVAEIHAAGQKLLPMLNTIPETLPAKNALLVDDTE